jgi:hypothetical protein
LEYRYDLLRCWFNCLFSRHLCSGYIQGMNDLLVPITILMENKYVSFWCFSGRSLTFFFIYLLLELIANMQGLFDKHHVLVQDLMKKALIYLEVRADLLHCISVKFWFVENRSVFLCLSQKSEWNKFLLLLSLVFAIF